MKQVKEMPTVGDFSAIIQYEDGIFGVNFRWDDGFLFVYRDGCCCEVFDPEFFKERECIFYVN